MFYNRRQKVNSIVSQIHECLLCGKEAQLIERNYPGYQEPDSFSIYNCKYCDTQFSHPRIATKHIYEMIYKKAEAVPGYDRYYRYRDKVKAAEKPLQYLAGTEEAYWVINDTLKQDFKNKLYLQIGAFGQIDNEFCSSATATMVQKISDNQKIHLTQRRKNMGNIQGTASEHHVNTKSYFLASKGIEFPFKFREYIGKRIRR